MTSINTNLPALTAQRNMGLTQALFHKTVTRLSSGLRINSAADDAAGSFLGQKLKNQVRGLQQASRNAQDGVGLLQTAEGGLSVHNDILLRLRELAVQSANGIMTDSDRALTISPEASSLLAELTRVSQTTKFNGVNLLDGKMGGAQVTLGTNVGKVTSGGTVVYDPFTTDMTGTDITSAHGIDGIVATTAGSNPVYYAIKTTPYSTLTDSVSVSLLKLDTTTDADASDNDAAVATQTITISNVSAIKGSKALNFDTFGIQLYVNNKIGTDGLAAPAPASMDHTAPASGTNFVNNGFTVSSNLFQTDTDRTTVGIQTTSNLSEGLNGVLLQVGANNVSADQLTLLSMNDMSAAGLGLSKTIAGSSYDLADNLKTQTGSLQAIDIIDLAVQQVAGERANIGAIQNRLDYSITNLGVAAENNQAAVSRIFDADVASEVSELVRTQILSQSAMAILAQANAAPQALLSLFR